MQYLIIPGAITVFSMVVILLSLQMDLSPAMVVGDSLQPRVFPILLMMVTLVLTVVLAVQGKKAPPKKAPKVDAQTWGSILLFVVF